MLRRRTLRACLSCPRPCQRCSPGLATAPSFVSLPPSQSAMLVSIEPHRHNSPSTPLPARGTVCATSPFEICLHCTLASCQPSFRVTPGAYPCPTLFVPSLHAALLFSPRLSHATTPHLNPHCLLTVPCACPWLLSVLPPTPLPGSAACPHLPATWPAFQACNFSGHTAPLSLHTRAHTQHDSRQAGRQAQVQIA